MHLMENWTRFRKGSQIETEWTKLSNLWGMDDAAGKNTVPVLELLAKFYTSGAWLTGW